MLSRDELSKRAKVLNVDDMVLATCRTLAPVVAEKFPARIREHYTSLGEQPLYRDFKNNHSEALAELGWRHFVGLFENGFDDAYIASNAALNARETLSKFDARSRLGQIATLSDVLLEHIATKYRFSGRKAAKVSMHVTRLLLMDAIVAVSHSQNERQKDLQARQTQLETIANTFRTEVGELSVSFVEAAGDLSSDATAARQTINTASEAVKASQSAVDESRNATAMTAAAVEQLAASIAEIRMRAEQSTSKASVAVKDGGAAQEAVSKLTEAADRVGSIVSTITEIAEQTNLLALNATIEAARAGDAGRGFAVVASEVKSLATQTAKATGEIGDQIAAIQQAAEACVAQISRIQASVHVSSEMAISIASAVNQQTSATTEISQQAQASYRGSQRMGGAVSDLGVALDDFAQVSDKIIAASGSLGMRSNGFSDCVETFIGKIRSI